MLVSDRPETKLREGNVFTAVCDYVHRGGLCSGVSLSGADDPPHGNVRAVRILMECIPV